MTYADILKLTKQLPDKKSEIFILAEAALGASRSQIIAFPDRKIDIEKQEELLCSIKQLKNNRPIQYILGKWEFCGREFLVGEGVLIPREDTIAVLELAKKRLAGRENTVFADLGSGSGCIAVTLSQDISAQGFAVEKSSEGYEYLNKNLALSQGRVKAILGDMFDESVIKSLPPLDLVISNPPYITREEMKELSSEVLNEPHSALFGGEDGLDFYRKITQSYKHKLKCGGVIVFEVGYRQADAVTQILLQNGFSQIEEQCDFAGIRRAVSAIKEV